MLLPGEDSEAWKALLSLFDSTEREQLIRLLGFSKEEVEKEVGAAIEKLGTGMWFRRPVHAWRLRWWNQVKLLVSSLRIARSTSRRATRAS